MRVIGLTGGIGTGKSSVAAILRARGVTVIDADAATRAVQEPGSEGLRELAAAFGPGILGPDGSLNRGALAAVAFSSEASRARLNAIVHPRVRAWMAERQREAEAAGAAVVVHDIPLLYESRGEAMFEAVILVYAHEEVAVRRLVEQRGFAEADARARVAAQLPIESKRSRTPFVIDNGGSRDDLPAQVARVWAEVTASRSSGP